MRLALIGYGKMGKTVEEAALSRGHSVGVIIDNNNDWDTKRHLLRGCDAAVEFTAPAVAVENIMSCLKAGIPVVSGTTGWNDRFQEVAEYCRSLNGTLIYSSNFSLGVNIFFEINRKLAQLMNPHHAYDVSIEEIHHTQKLDSPSGTAIVLGEAILENINRKSRWVNQATGNKADLVINSGRIGVTPGTHTVIYESENDRISIRHEAKNRKGLALGAVMAAEFIAGKKGIFTMKDMLNL